MNLGVTNFKELQEKYPAININSIIEPILKYYQRKGLKENKKHIWLDKVKDELVLEKLEEDEKIQEEDYSKDSEKIRSEFIELISGKNKKWGKATELLTQYVTQKLTLYTTKDDKKSEVWVYKEGIYIPNGRSEIKELLRKTLSDFYSSFVYNKVIEKVEPDTYIDVDTFFGQKYMEEIPIKNGILNIFTRELKEFTPKKIFFNKLPIKYNPESNCPKIDEFLSEVLAHQEDKKVFYEMGGFCLLKDYKFEKAFMLVGDGRNGKDKSLELLKRTLGLPNCCSVPLSSLIPDSFVISEFFGKLANVAGDIGSDDLKDTSIFKALTGRSVVTGQRKFLPSITFVNYAKFIFACNELPFAYDNSRGFWDRWILLEYPYTFVTKEEKEQEQNKNNPYYKIKDENIIEKITTEEELSGLLNRFLDGLNNLIKNKKFSATKGTEEIKEMWIRKSNSVMAFCMDNIEEDYEGFITKKDFRKKYVKYCKKHKVKVKTDYVVKRTLTEMYGVIEGRKAIFQSSEYERVWEGIKWKK